jgi:hypothetical protein
MGVFVGWTLLTQDSLQCWVSVYMNKDIGIPQKQEFIDHLANDKNF